MSRLTRTCLLLVTLAAWSACTRLTAVDWGLIKADEASAGADGGGTAGSAGTNAGGTSSGGAATDGGNAPSEGGAPGAGGMQTEGGMPTEAGAGGHDAGAGGA